MDSTGKQRSTGESRKSSEEYDDLSAADDCRQVIEEKFDFESRNHPFERGQDSGGCFALSLGVHPFFPGGA